ncbi:MAG: hypothetical protein A2604_01485 [Candidatus Liptonbacteria bacterium RIFOXYD1_FULL_36_11]|uniref:Septum formation initiator n=1 Tax=Candidatus Liptonbacteria bacterium RIFOXYD1_FULL_36_11 TaxID=1798656 RepID=A0A1G2CT61_9BACT|nr:MAG: hypothetical protein A2604_01485 [Candidatus Liptonbacteria bacterium RIFOXYD1_FULL_36_11]
MRDWWKIIVIFILIVLIFAVGYGVTVDYFEFGKGDGSFKAIEAQVLKLRQENKGMEKDLNYYSNPYNLEKEIKSRYNYKVPGEKMLVIPN